MHKVKARKINRNESGKFNGDTGLMENPIKGIIKFDDTLPLTQVAHYDGLDDAWIMTNEEKEALTSGKNLMIPASFVMKLLTLDEALETVRAILEDLKGNARGEQVKSAEEGQG